MKRIFTILLIAADAKTLTIQLQALEKFRVDVNYQGLIEEVNAKKELENQLCRFIHAMKK